MMSTGKRKRDLEAQDSDDDELGPMGLRQILPVAALPDDFSGVPTDGMQYLFTVRRDARSLPRFTRAINPYEQPSAAAAADTHPSSSSSAAPPPPPRDHYPHLPRDDWRAVFAKRFRNFRKNVVQPTIYVDLTAQERPAAGLMPEKREREHWWAFIAGRPASEWTATAPAAAATKKKKEAKKKGRMRAFADDEGDDEDGRAEAQQQETWHINEEGEVELALRVDPAESLPTPSGSPAPTDERAHTPREPTPGLLKHMDNRMCLHLLMYMTHWIQLYLREPESGAWTITETHGRWMFALLSRVDERVTADEMSGLRSLARAALGLVKHRLTRSGDDEGMSLGSCWAIVTAVAGIWGQRDLWMDAEQVLTGVS